MPPGPTRWGAARTRKHVETVAKMGKDDNNPHQPEDPFEALKQARQNQVEVGGRRRGSSNKKAKEAEVAKSKKNRQIIFAGLLVASVAAFFFTDQTEEPSQQPTQQAVNMQKKKAQVEAIEKRKAEARAEMQAKLNKQLEEVEVEDMEAFTVDEEEQLIVRIPEEFRNGAKAKVPVRPPGLNGSLSTEMANTPGVHSGLSLMTMCVRVMLRPVPSSGRMQPAYEQALQMQPNSGKIRARYGNALFKQGNMDGAEVELRQALSRGAAVAHKYLGTWRGGGGHLRCQYALPGLPTAAP